MSTPDDVSDEMRGLPFDETGVDALLDGRVAEDDAPPGFQDVARLVLAARSPATPDELVGEEHVVAVLAAATSMTGIGETDAGAEGLSTSEQMGEGRRRMLGKILTAKMAAAAAVAVLGGGVAAAATGSLPTSLQSSVSHGLSDLGIGVPDPANNPPDLLGGSTGTTTGTTAGSTTPPSTTTGTTMTGTTSTVTGATATTSTAPSQAVGPSASGPALYGLCTAYAASSGSQAARHSVAFRNLTRAATAKSESVAKYCATVVPPATRATTGTTLTTGSTGSSTGSTVAPTTQGPPIMPAVQGSPVTRSAGGAGASPGNSSGHGSHGGGHGHSAGGHG